MICMWLIEYGADLSFAGFKALTSGTRDSSIQSFYEISVSMSSSIHIAIAFLCARYLNTGFMSVAWQSWLACQIWQIISLHFQPNGGLEPDFFESRISEESSAVIKKVLLWGRTYYHENESCGVRKKVLSLERKVSRETERFAVRNRVLPWHLGATIIFWSKTRILPSNFLAALYCSGNSGNFYLRHSFMLHLH